MRSTKSVATSVREAIERGGTDRIWTYSDFAFPQPYAVAATLSRLSRKGVLTRVRKGVYYVPKETRFGRTRPDPRKLAAALLDRHGVVWKPTGLSMYNALGLTSQVSAVATFAVDDKARSLSLPPGVLLRRRPADNLKRASAEERAVLDALRELRSIPGSSEEEILNRICELFRSGELSFDRVARLASTEPPRVRALLGAIGSQIAAPQALLRTLRESLNPLTRFRARVGRALPSARDWNIA